MKAKKLVCTILAGAMCLGLAACGGGGGSADGDGGGAKVLRFNVGFDPDTFDPAASNVLENAIECIPCTDFLYRENLDGEFAPSLAEGYTVTDDGMEYTFTLRSGLMFADGSPLTANDVKFSWTRALDPANAFEYAYQLYYIKNGAAFNAGECSADELGLEVIDDTTIKVTLENPTPFFISLTGFTTYGIVSEAFCSTVDSYGANVDSTLSCGPFVPAEWNKGQYVKYVKNENYWDKDSVNLDELYIYCVSESSTEIQMYDTDQLDLTYMTMSTADQTRLRAEGVLETWGNLNTRYIMVNNEKITDPKVRTALEYALDLQTLAEKVVTNCDPATGFVPATMSAVDDSSKPFRTKTLIPASGDVEEAQRLLAEAGYPNGEGFPTDYELIYTTGEANKALAEAIVEMWRTNLGISVTAANLEGTVRRDRKNNGDYEFSLDGWSTDYLDPYSFLEICQTGNAYNQGRYSNSEYDAKLKIAATSNDQSVRQTAMAEAEEILIEDMGLMPLYCSVKSFMMKDYVSGISFSLMGTCDFKWADVQK